MRSVVFGLCAVVMLVACGSSGGSGIPPGEDGGPMSDAAPKDGSGSENDASSVGPIDAGSGKDRDVDAGEAVDSAAPLDAGTDSADGAVQSTGTGALSVHVASPGASFGVLTWAIGGPAGGAPLLAGSLDVASGAPFDFVVPAGTVGTGFAIAFSAPSTDDSVTCTGTVTFSITARKTTAISTILVCGPTEEDSGSILVTVGGDGGGIELCPTLDGLGISPSEVIVGGTIVLTAFAEAPNTSALAIAWSATAGHLMPLTGGSAVLTCTSPGVITVTATATDGPGLGGAPICSATLAGSVQCDASDGGP